MLRDINGQPVGLHEPTDREMLDKLIELNPMYPKEELVKFLEYKLGRQVFVEPNGS